MEDGSKAEGSRIVGRAWPVVTGPSPPTSDHGRGRKLADVHVKIPTEVRIQDYPEAIAQPVIRLRERLLEIGFYEIISESGNAIYAGQFVGSKDATEVFRSLDAHATTYGLRRGARLAASYAGWVRSAEPASRHLVPPRSRTARAEVLILTSLQPSRLFGWLQKVLGQTYWTCRGMFRHQRSHGFKGKPMFNDPTEQQPQSGLVGYRSPFL